MLPGFEEGHGQALEHERLDRRMGVTLPLLGHPDQSACGAEGGAIRRFKHRELSPRIGRAIRTATIRIGDQILAGVEAEGRDDLDGHGREGHDHDLAISTDRRLRVGLRQRRANFLQQLGLAVAGAGLVAMEDIDRHAEQDVDVARRGHSQRFGPGPDQQAVLRRLAMAVVPAVQGCPNAHLLACTVDRLLLGDPEPLHEGREALPNEHPPGRGHWRRGRQRNEEAQGWTRERWRSVGISPI